MNNEYSDTNGNGIPDAFENRPSIREILNPEIVRAENRLESGDYVLAGRDAYLVYGERGVVLLEIKDVLNRCSAACLFKSVKELTEFINRLEEATSKAFRQETIAID